MDRPGLATEVTDQAAYDHALARFRERHIVMPTFAQLADPAAIPASAVGDAEPDAPDPRNLFRVHWYNAADRRGRVEVPAHLVLPSELTGVAAPIVIALADRFPMIA
jgi:cysteine synthase A